MAKVCFAFERVVDKLFLGTPHQRALKMEKTFPFCIDFTTFELQISLLFLLIVLQISFGFYLFVKAIYCSCYN